MADNCEPRKIDSNRTGLSFAETICGVLPTLATDGFDPIWFELEPNSYDEMGGTLTTTARSPISASRQRKKGVITDLTAGGGFNTDFTKSNLFRLFQGFFFADARQKPQTNPLNGDPVVITGADTTADTLTAANGLTRFRPGAIVLVSGFLNAGNNGVHIVSAVSDTALTLAANLNTEAAPAGVEVRTVGYQLPAGDASILMLGSLPQLALATAPDAADGTITIAAVDDGDTVTVGDVVYTFANVITDPFDVLIGGTVTATAQNLVAAINGGVLNTPAHPRVFASNVAGVVTVTATIPGASGNDIVLVEDANDVTVSGAELTGGTGFSLRDLGVIVGEWVYLGADSIGNRFANNSGFARVGTLTDQAITFDKTTWVGANEAGTGKSVHVYVGDTVKNEKDEDLIVTRYYEFERTLGRDGDGVQSEYLTRSVANEFTLNIPLPEGEDAKLNADLSFISGDSEQRSGAEGRKVGLHVPAPGEDAINTANNIVRMRMTLVDPATSRPLPLFAYVVEGNISINNNVTQVKAIGTLGAIDVNVGDFDAGGELTAIFSDVAATKAVRNNADVTVDFIGAAGNAGFVFDFPLVTLGGGSIQVEPGQEIRVPLEMLGAENPLGYTLLYTAFAYLPTLAMPKQGVAY